MSSGSVTARRPRLAGALLRTQPDERLAELAGDGSEQAFEELIRRHRANLVTFAGSIAPSGYADDVVQDSLVKAQTALGRGDRPEFAKAWLYKIVRNTALNERRGHREHDEIPADFDGVEQPPQAFERSHEIKNLVVALNDLPEAQRQALVQRELEGRGHDEIAGALEVSPGAVRQLIHRARTTLRTGAGAIVPAFLLRAAVLGGGSEQAIGGAAATGLGLGGAKLGLGALLATGAIVTGVEVGTEFRGEGKIKAPVAAEAAASAPATYAAPAAAGADESSSQAATAKVKAAAKLTGGRSEGDRPPPPHRRHDGSGQYGSQPPPPQDGGGAATGGGGSTGGGGAGAGAPQKPAPPLGGGSTGGAGHLKPPPPTPPLIP